MRPTVGWRVCDDLISIGDTGFIRMKGRGMKAGSPTKSVFFRLIRLFLVMTCACAAAPARADDPRVEELVQRVKEIQRRLDALKAARVPDKAAGLKTLQQSSAAQFAGLHKKIDTQPRVRMPNGRLSVVSAEGDFSLALRATVQFDVGYFSQGKNPPNVDLNSGTNFRRAQFGLVGTLFRDWSYNFTYDFGGSGTENRGKMVHEIGGATIFRIRVHRKRPVAAKGSVTSE